MGGADCGDSSVAGSSVAAAAAAVPTAVNGSADAPRRSFFFSRGGELRDLVKALMGLSQLPDGPTTAAAASASASAAKAGGGAGGGGGNGGGGLGLKLTFSLGVLAIGLSDAASSLDARGKVRVHCCSSAAKRGGADVISVRCFGGHTLIRALLCVCGVC